MYIKRIDIYIKGCTYYIHKCVYIYLYSEGYKLRGKKAKLYARAAIFCFFFFCSARRPLVTTFQLKVKLHVISRKCVSNNTVRCALLEPN